MGIRQAAEYLEVARDAAGRGNARMTDAERAQVFAALASAEMAIELAEALSRLNNHLEVLGIVLGHRGDT